MPLTPNLQAAWICGLVAKQTNRHNAKRSRCRLGKGDAVQRLCGKLQVNISKARTLLGWVYEVGYTNMRRGLDG